MQTNFHINNFFLMICMEHLCANLVELNNNDDDNNNNDNNSNNNNNNNNKRSKKKKRLED